MFQIIRNKWSYALLLIPVLSGIMAIICNDFIFKSGVAGTCIFIILVQFFRKLNHRSDMLIISAAFSFSIGGDWCLSNRNGDAQMFIAGILLFLIAHTGYLSFGLINGKINRRFTIILLSGYLSFFSLMVYPSINNQILLFVTLVYLLISCFSLGAAAGIKGIPFVRWFYFSGIFLILFSDTIIAFSEFLSIDKLNYMILPSYYLAQIFITAALIRKGLKTTQKSQMGRLLSKL